jgi:Phosphotransferase enzyme family
MLHACVESPAGETQIPWQGPARAGWLNDVEAWLRPRIQRLGRRIVGPLRCVRDHAWAIVVRVPCSDGPMFFKAAGPREGYELAILEALGPHWNDRLPTVLASDRQRGWFLLADHGCTLREHLAGADAARPWLHLLPSFAQIQIAEMPFWHLWGVPDRRPQVLPEQLRALLDDPAVLRLGQADGLTHERHAELRALLPEFDACCEALSAQAPTLNHGDLHDRNVLVRDGQYRFIDFGDSCVTHPLCVLLMPCQKNVRSWFDARGRQLLEQLCGAYLDAWRDHRDAATLRPLLGRALWVAHVVRALTWEQLGRAAVGEERRESLRQVSSWLNLFARRRALLQSPSF